MKSPLRYPGGKTRAVKYILPLFPEDMEELCSPFVGGGSIELALASKGVNVHAYDIFDPLVCFWQKLSQNSDFLANLATTYRPLSKEWFKEFQTALTCMGDYTFIYAAMFYALNRSSFSGATISGGYSKQAAEKRFTESSIQRLRDFKAHNFKVNKADFRRSIRQHPDAFLYLDPPYLLEKDKQTLYGNKGSTHKGFDHIDLANILKSRDDWILSYNNCPEILQLYGEYDILYPKWKYGMSQDKDSKEILIVNKRSK